jgi:WD40 repeat protein
MRRRTIQAAAAVVAVGMLVGWVSDSRQLAGLALAQEKQRAFGGFPMLRVLFLAIACLMPFLLMPFLAAPAAVAQRTPPQYTAAIAPDGKTLAESYSLFDSGGPITFHDLANNKVLFVCKGHTHDAVIAIAYSQDGRMLASADWMGTFRLWETATGKERAKFTHKDFSPLALAFSPNGKILASSSWKRSNNISSQVILWDVLTGKQQAVIEMGVDKPNIADDRHSGLAFSPDGRTLAYAAAYGPVRLWDVLTGKEQGVLHGHTAGVACVAFAPDGRKIATGSLDKTVRTWDAATGRQTAIFSSHKGPVDSMVFSPDGRMVASWCIWQQGTTLGTELKVWEAASGKERLKFVEPDQPNPGLWRRVFALQFTGDSKALLVVTADRQGVDRLDLAKLAVRPK